MATKKKSTALAALNGDISGSTLAKAGVEVKLTKSEIAEYIASKAMSRIEAEICQLRDVERIGYGWSRKLPVVPKRFRALINALNALDAEKQFAVYLHVGGCPQSEDDAQPYYRISRDCGEQHERYFGENGVITYPAEKGEELPQEAKDWIAKTVRLSVLHNKRAELSSKNYKVLLVESVLSGTTAGTTVLADLSKMVEEMVKV